MNFTRPLLLAACIASLLICPFSVAQQTTQAPVKPEANQAQTNNKVSAFPAAAQTKISGALGRDRREYQSVTQPGGFRVENSRHGLWAEFTPGRVSFRSGANHWGMSLLGYGYGDNLRDASTVAPHADANRIEYRRDGLTEWYVNGPLGIEQGFTLTRSPGKSQGMPLTFDLALSGELTASVDPEKRSLSLSKDATAALRYAGLTATDAAGHELRAWLEVAENHLWVRVDDAQAQYPLTIDPLIQSAKLTASDGVANDNYGSSLSVSADGNTFVIGAPSAAIDSKLAQGAAYVFVRPANGWTDSSVFATKLTAPDGAADDLLGSSVSVSSDGGTIIVGAPGFNSAQGAAYIFNKPAGGWSDTSTFAAKLTTSGGASGDKFGSSVQVNWDSGTILVGAPFATIGSNSTQGASYVFVKPVGGWTDTSVSAAKLTASDGVAFDEFGYSMSISTDQTIVIGAPGFTAGLSPNFQTGHVFASGSAYVFVKPANGWQSTNETAKLTASDSAYIGTLPFVSPPTLIPVNNLFGFSVCISADSSTIVVGKPGAVHEPNQSIQEQPNTGAAYIFVKPPDGWATATQTVAFRAQLFFTPTKFGSSVTTSSDGGTVLVGEPGVPSGGLPTGASVLSKPTGGWADATSTAFKARLTAVDGAASDSFGASAAMSNDGNTILLGAPGAAIVSSSSQGAAYVFTNSVSGSAQASFSPANLDFGNQLVGSTSSAQTVTLTNSGGAPLDVTSVIVAPNFTSTQNCLTASPLAPGATCLESVAFAPNSSGKLSGTLTFTDDSDGTAGTNQAVPLNGTGFTPSAASLSPTSLSFASQTIGSTSASQTVTLNNTGGSPLQVSGVAVSANFTSTQNCLNKSLKPGDSCSENVNFAPGSAGPLIGTLTFTDDSGGTAGANQTASLNGTGVTPATASVSPLSVSFGNQAVGTTSAAQTVTVTNTGGSPLSMSAVAASSALGSFSSTKHCVSASPIAPSSSCSESVTFTPNGGGPFGGTLTFTDDSGGTAGVTQSVSLSGTGVVPTASLSPKSLSFGNQTVGTTSAPQTVTLNNTGDAPLHVSAVTPSLPANFTSTQNCVAASPLAAGASCTESVRFAPLSDGAVAGTLTFADDSGGTAGVSQLASLSGTGLLPPHASLPVLSVNFGNQNVGTTSSTQSVTLTNSGGSPLHVAAAVVSAKFTSTQNCVAASPLAAGASCSENVAFSPDSSGPLAGTLTFTDDSGGTAGATQSVSLSGVGVTPAAASVSPLSINFGNQMVGTNSGPQAVTLSNTGGSPLHVTGVVVSANFTSTQNCSVAIVAPGSSCSESVTMNPGSAGPLTGTLTFSDDSGGTAGTKQTVALSGTGVLPTAALSATTLSFGNQAVGTTSPAQTVTLTNTGGAPLSVSAVAASSASANFSSTNHCVTASPLAPGASCSENVNFTPTSAGPLSGTLTFTDNSGGGPTAATQTVVLSGTGAVPIASLSPVSLSFGNQAVATTSNAQTVTLKNTGGAALHITALTVSPNFISTHNCVTASPLAAGGTCSEAVSFAPGSVLPFGGTLTFADDSGGTGGATQLVPLSGTGVKASTSTGLSAAPTTVLTGQAVTLTFSVAAQLGETLTPTGIVAVSANTGESCSGPASSGSCVLTFQSAGTRTISAIYGGDANFLSSTSSGIQVSVNVPTADLFITQQPGLTSVKAGGNLAYSLTLKNLGPNVAASVAITDPVPANSTFVSISKGAPCSTPAAGSVGTITCSWGSLASGAFVNVTITVAVNGSGNRTSISNTAVASAATFDPNMANNSATVTTQITGNKK